MLSGNRVRNTNTELQRNIQEQPNVQINFNEYHPEEIIEEDELIMVNEDPGLELMDIDEEEEEEERDTNQNNQNIIPSNYINNIEENSSDK